MTDSSSAPQNTEQLIREANKAYYEGDPIMIDAEYDALERDVVGENPDVVAGGYIPESRKVEHVQPMLSLAKVHSEDDLITWLRKVRDKLGWNLHSEDSPVMLIEPKWDGLSIEVVVKDGEFSSASTRGNGVVGEDVTETASRIPTLQNHVTSSGVDNGPLYFEVTISESNLLLINDLHELDYKNTRNAAAGILRREDQLGREMAWYLEVVPHGVTDHTYSANLYMEREIVEFVHQIEAQRTDSIYPSDIDGVVIKFKDQTYRGQLGAGSHSPHWAVAYKFPAEQAVTTLREVNWTKGRTGKITPRATFDPILLVGASIRNATLHNIDFITEKNLRIGDRIRVQRSGDVIPYVVEVVERGDGEPIVVPDDIDSEDVILDQIRYGVAQLGADGIGPAAINAMIEKGLINEGDVVDALDSMLKLTPGDIASLPGYGQASEAKILYEISCFQYVELGQWIAALGIPGMGWTYCDRLARWFGSIVEILTASENDLSSIPGFGPSKIESLIGEMIPRSDQAEKSGLIFRLGAMLDRNGITPSAYEEEEVRTDTEWSGKKIVITGSLDGYNRSDLSAKLEGLGATMQGSVSSTTDILIAGEKAGSKLAKAESLGVTVLNADAVIGNIMSS